MQGADIETIMQEFGTCEEGEPMMLSYRDLFDREKGRQKIKAQITTWHQQAAAGQPVIVLEDGGALDLMSWVTMDYEFERYTKEEGLLLASRADCMKALTDRQRRFAQASTGAGP